MQGLLSRVAVGVFALLTIAMILLALFDDRGALALRERRATRDILGTEVHAATQQNEELRKEIQELRHDPDAIERRARERLNLVKPDEIIIQIPESRTESPAPAK
jgi:cell division protein FtsB